jgi:hypothetical protein
VRNSDLTWLISISNLSFENRGCGGLVAKERERGENERQRGGRTEIYRERFAREKKGARARGEVEGT